ncbi:helicase RepA family protein [Enterobacter mori]|uniref:AAA family ATPase n=1 Tax=Enterobacter mori TaxID=539813 RepID=UPI001EE48761|nr:AAA family ATPase [Enterobacter mori]MCG5130335.1 helicase RepA family protein [Enterobacter mori]
MRTGMFIDWSAIPDYHYTLAIDYSSSGNYGEWSEFNGINDDLCDIELAEIQLQSEKRLRPVIENLFNRKQVGFLYGESNTGKSFVALSLLNRVAQGKPWAGLRVAKECHAFYFDGETGVEIKDRNTAWCNKFNNGFKNERMHILSPQINLFDKEIQRRIISDVNKITNSKGGIICFDTLSSFLAYYSKQSIDGTTTLDMENPDENDAIAMRKLISILKRIAVETNSFVLMVHHGGKDAAKGMKGAITLKNDSDTVIKLEQIQGNDFGLSVSLTIEKNRSAAKLPIMQFDLCAVDNGITASELHEFDNELCDYPDETEKGYHVNTSTKTLVFVDKPTPVIAAGKIERKQANDEPFIMQQSPKNDYAKMHTQQRQPMTPQQQCNQLVQNAVNAESYEAGANYTKSASHNNALAFDSYMSELRKKNATAQERTLEKIIELTKHSVNGCINESDLTNALKAEYTTMQSNNIKRAISGLERCRFIVNNRGMIHILPPPAQIMTT